MSLRNWLLSWLRPSADAGKDLRESRDTRAAAAAPDDVDDAGSAWCVVANILLERGHGPGGVERRRGTKHFAPGAKVYVYYFFWGTGGDRVSVVGRQRKSRRYIHLTMPAKHLDNWRVELVYSPSIVKTIREFGEFAGTGNAESRRIRAEEIVRGYVDRGAIVQHFVTRPPTSGDT